MSKSSSNEDLLGSNIRMNFIKPSKKSLKKMKRNLERRHDRDGSDHLLPPMLPEDTHTLDESPFNQAILDSDASVSLPQFIEPVRLARLELELDLDPEPEVDLDLTELFPEERLVRLIEDSEDVSTEENEGDLLDGNLGTVPRVMRKASIRDRFMLRLRSRGQSMSEPSQAVLGSLMDVGPLGGLMGNPYQLDKVEEGRVSQETLSNEVHDIMMSHNASTQSNDTSSATFLAPNPDYYIRHELDDEYDISDHEENPVDGYVAPPRRVQAGVLSSLLKLYKNEETHLPHNLPVSPKKEVNKLLVESVKIQNGVEELKEGVKRSLPRFRKKRNETKQREKAVNYSQDELSDDSSTAEMQPVVEPSLLPTFKTPHKPRKTLPAPSHRSKRRAHQVKITVHIADILQRQRFILRMCKALMLYGAPSHRLEEYLVMTSRVLEIDGQFIYFPGCMIVSFGDANTHTSETQLVRCAQGVELARLADTHAIYKAVIHDIMGVAEALVKLDEILSRRQLYPPWVLVLNYGFALAFVAPWSFGGSWIDMPMCFWVGCLVGILQNYVAPKCNLYSNVFEICASILISFCARALGSINGGSTFCFSSITQGSLALILPGYMVLCGSLELLTRNTVSGAVRMVYAIIYFLFLGFGITLGAAIYGWIDSSAVSETTCRHNLSPWWNFLFVPMFTIGLGILSHARWQQLPIMVVILGAGTAVSYFANLHFSRVTEFSSAMGVFTIGVLGNLYSRMGRGMAVLAILPGIMCQLPGGIGAKSTLMAGVATANKIVNGTDTDNLSSLSFGVALLEITIGITVGLFAATLAVYPFGKRSTGLFTL